MESQQIPTISIDGEPLFSKALLAATQRQRHSHGTGAYMERKAKCFVKLGCILDKIQFVPPSITEEGFGGGLGYIP
jgi:hypothetical protein